MAFGKTQGVNALPRREKVRLPPKRGQIKVKIFRKFLQMVVTVTSKAGRGLGIKKKKVIAEER